MLKHIKAQYSERINTPMQILQNTACLYVPYTMVLHF
jgi:hypothetical protein